MQNFICGIFVVLLISGVTVGAHSEDSDKKSARAKIDLSRLYTGYADYLELRQKAEPDFTPIYRIMSKKVPSEEVKLHFEFQGKTYEITPLEGGMVHFRPTAEMLDANPVVWSNQPKGTLSMKVNARLIWESEIPYNLKNMHSVVHKAWGDFKGLGGFMSFLAPRHVPVIMEFSEECVGDEWTMLRGKKIITSGKNETLTKIDFTKKAVRRSDSLTLTCKPEALYIG